MSEESKEQELELVEPGPQAPDLMLETFVKLADSGVEVALTLSVSGVVITGTLVGRRRWLSLFRQATERAGEMGALIGGHIEGAWVKAMEDEDDTLPYGFLHLRDARYLQGSGQFNLVPQDGGLLWRGRLSEISGWSLGAIHPA